MIRKMFVAGFLCILAFASIPGCKKEGTPSEGNSTKLNVVCTTGMIADAAKSISGDQATIINLMGEGVDPHSYKATPADIKNLSKADLILYNGLMLEGKMGELFKRMAKDKAVVAVSEAVPQEKLRQSEAYEGHPDPHVWFDVTLWKDVVEKIRDTLIAEDPEGKAKYEENAKKYLEKLSALDEYCKKQLASIPEESRVLITAHDAFGYFGAAYSIEVRGLQGISTESEPNLKEVNNLVNLLVDRKIKAVFVESSVPPRHIEALVEGCQAKGHTIAIGGELFSDAMGAEGTPEGTYDGMVRHNVDTIIEALK